MQLATLDLVIIAAYFAITVGIGIYISKRASGSSRSYFLGGNDIPWYYLGVSNASGMFDISGTMWMVSLLFIYGLKSVWIPWLWPQFNQIFLMVFLSAWLRRSGVMTGAEWITYRFGDSPGARLSHLSVVVFALLSVIGFLAYGFVGIGKFAAVFIPYELSTDATTNEVYYGLILTALTTVYAVKGGMFSVVFTEVLQFVVMTIAGIAVGVIGLQLVSPELLSTLVPAGWSDIGFGWTLDLDWASMGGELAPLYDAVTQQIDAEDGFTLFGALMMMMIFKGTLVSLAGPAPNYDMQRILSARNAVEAQKMSGLVSLVLLVPRYMLIAGLGVIGLAFLGPELLSGIDPDSGLADFERILPLAMERYVPAGLLGLLIAGLLAAFMSTFAATTNAAPAYAVNDIYRKYLKPGESERHYVVASYICATGFVIIGTLIGLYADSLTEVIKYITAGLWGGYAAANVLKWYWWRFNGWGYFWGMASGMATAIALTFTSVDVLFVGFPVILAVSTIGSFAGALLTEPDDEALLVEFYRTTRPWGFWAPIRAAAQDKYPGLRQNPHLGRDAVNVAVGVAWQTALTATGIYLVVQDWTALGVSVLIVVATMAWLKVNWWETLGEPIDEYVDGAAVRGLSAGEGEGEVSPALEVVAEPPGAGPLGGG